MRFCMWNVRSLYSLGSLTAIARDLAWCNLDLMGVQEVRWDKRGTVSIFLSVEKETKITNWEQVFLTPQNSIRS